MDAFKLNALVAAVNQVKSCPVRPVARPESLFNQHVSLVFPRQRQDTNSGSLLSRLWSTASGGGSQAGGAAGAGSGSSSGLHSPQPHLSRLVSSGDSGASDNEGFVPQVRGRVRLAAQHGTPAAGLSWPSRSPRPPPAHAPALAH